MTPQFESEPIAVVIPALNEAPRIAACLKSLRPFALAGDPILVVDAASTDDTSKIAAEAGATVLSAASRNRACAIRLGYEHASRIASVVLIAHADMQFPPAARSSVDAALTANPEAPAAFLGHRIDDPRWRFRIIERGNRFRARRGLPYGDQAMVVRTHAVAASGGFPHVGSLEDLELALRLRTRGRWLDVNCPVTIDARHWRDGIIRTTLRNWRTVIRHRRTRKPIPTNSQAVEAAAPMTTRRTEV